MMHRGCFLSLLALAGLVFVSPARAQTKLDFENLPNPTGSGQSNTLQGVTVSQNGFTVSATTGNIASITPDAMAQANYTGSVSPYQANPNRLTILTQDNGNPFRINSIDLANLFTQAAVPGGFSVTFTGDVQGGGTVTQTFTHLADDSLTTFNFDNSFNNLTALEFTQGDNTTTHPYQFDNVVVNGPAAAPTPEPGSLALLTGLCCAGSGAIAFRHRRRSPQRLENRS